MVLRFLLCLLALPLVHADDAAEVLRLERAAMERWSHGDPDGFLELLDPGIVFFDPSLARRADGLEQVVPLYEAERGRIDVEVEFVHPKVQLAGDCAVLTFNLVTRERAGERRARRWHATEVFRRTGGRWRILHGHYSLAK